MKRLIQNNKTMVNKYLKSSLFMLVLVASCLSCRSSRLIATDQVVHQDTTTIEVQKIVSYKPLERLNLSIGETTILDDLGIKVTRISDSSAFVLRSQTLIERKQTEVRTVATKTVDRSKDKSIHDSMVGSSIKDKSQTGSHNKSKKSDNQKVKVKEKTIQRKANLWWLLLLIGVGIAAFIIYKKVFR